MVFSYKVLNVGESEDGTVATVELLQDGAHVHSMTVSVPSGTSLADAKAMVKDAFAPYRAIAGRASSPIPAGATFT